jgi:methylase of polypeptide subunit release factors
LKSKPLYYASFIPGLQEEIANVVRQRFGDCLIHKLLDGAILFETSVGYDKFNFFCFNNIFVCLSVMEHNLHTGTLEKHINTVIHGNKLLPDAEMMIAHNSKKFKTFRVVALQENQPAAVDEKLRLAAEQFIGRLSGLKVNRAKPDAEFWFLHRKEEGRSFTYFMKRLTLRPSWEKSLHSGELPPPLAWMLCRLGELKSGNTVLDPFCGYGSIPQAALKFFHVKQFIACDSNEKAAAYTAARMKNHQDKFILYKNDFSSLAELLPEKSIDTIITDPPWGLYQEKEPCSIPVAQFYEKMFSVFDILLKPNGKIVILGERSEELPKAAKNYFSLKKTIPILLSGKKAAIFIFDRI